MRRSLALALVVLAAGGCEEAPREPRPPTKIINRYHDQLLALPDQLQRLGVMRAIRDNGRRCQRVEATAYQQDFRDMAMWVALCSDGRHWALFIAATGDTQVRECRDAAELDLPPCRPITGPGAPPEQNKVG